MIRLAIVNHDGSPVLPKDITKVEDLREAAKQARTMIRDCEHLADVIDRAGKAGPKGTPYLT